MKIASWNVNSIRARIDHVSEWLKVQQPDVLLLQELKASEFPALVFDALGYSSVAVTQKAYNGVAVLSRHPMETIDTTLAGDEADSHARYLEMTIQGIRMVNIYLPNGNPVGTEKFAYKLAWMDRLIKKMSAWREEGLPALIGGDFNVIPEDIDCHNHHRGLRMPCSNRNRGHGIVRCSISAIPMRSGRCIQRRAGNSRSGIIFGKRSSTIAVFVSIISCCRRPWPTAW